MRGWRRGLVLAVVLAVAGCTDHPLAPEPASDPSVPIQVEAGARFAIRLESNPSTGYSWRLARPLDERVVRALSSIYEPPENPVPGAGGWERWLFAAVTPGRAQIDLEYVRPWETDVPPARTASFTVEVR